MRKLLALAAVALLASCASQRTAEREFALTQAKAVGAPEDCVRLIDIDHTRVYSDSVIDFVMRNRDVYRNTLPNSCPSLGFNERFAYDTRTDRLCSVDVITVFDSGGGRGATCGLGKFQKVELPPRG